MEHRRRAQNRQPRAAGDLKRVASRFVFAAIALSICGGCHKSPASESPEKTADLDDLPNRLHAFEETQRGAIDFSRARSWSEIAGPDPIRVAKIDAKYGRAVGLLRNDSLLVLLDKSLREIAHLPTPKSPTGLAVDGDAIFVCGELSPRIDRYRFVEGRLVSLGSIAIEGAVGLRDLDIGPEGVLYVADEHDGKWIAIRASDAAWLQNAPFEKREYPGKIAPFRIERRGSYLIVDDLLDHSLTVSNVDARGFPSGDHPVVIRHDGPIWSFDAKATPGGLVIAAGGVEDRPLDRSGGFFGSIDSFVFLYRVSAGVATRLGSLNVSELGVVTPKAIVLDVDNHDSATTFVTGYGGENAARLTWNIGNDRTGAVTAISAGPLAPGSAAITEISAGSFVVANSLLDSWEAFSDRGTQTMFVHDSKSQTRSRASRIGEALFFTSLMAPSNSSDGAHSRFTCETCHFEGYVDGRTHFTGREDIHATTKPLRGLVNNRPHFSRALDPDLATVAMNEFRVANAGNDAGEWFVTDPADFPWIHDPGVEADALSPEDLRSSLIQFLIDFSPDENPSVEGRRFFSPIELLGAEVFRDHCETCHEARVASDDAKSRAPFSDWQRLVFSEKGSIVWGRASYEKTGVVPYVHELGARVPSLRRLAKKRPYFTNGSAPDLASVVDRARFSGADFFHANAPSNATALSPSGQRALIEFLDLL